MGLLRFALASMVVMFHLGGVHMLSGRLAVMGFYVVSGFLIARVLDTRYAGSAAGLGAFAANRLLRLYPTFLVVFALSAMAQSYIGEVAVVPDEPTRRVLAGEWNWTNLSLLPQLRDGFVLAGPSTLIPQSWSINVEITFYAVALVMAAVNLRWAMLLFLPVSLWMFVSRLYAAPTFGAFDNDVYKDAISTFVFFNVGALLHLTRLRLPESLFPWTIVGLLFAIYGLLGNHYLHDALEASTLNWHAVLLGCNVLMAGCVSLAIISAPEDSLFWRQLGDLSYPIYLNHMLISYLMMWVAEETGVQWFGRPNDISFAVNGLALSVLMALALERLVEIPVGVLRKRVRRLANSKPAAVAQPSAG